MATNFAPILGMKDTGYEVRLFPVTAGQTFIAGALVYLTSGALSECGADPTSIAGVALAPASMGLATAGSIWGGTKIPVALLSPTAIVFMASATTPVFATHVGTAYGLVKSTNWLVDISETSTTSVVVVDVAVSPQPEGFYVRFSADHLQFDAIAS